MVNDVINGITEAMAQAFPESDGYTIYTGDVPQEFGPRDFIVNSIMPNRDKKTYSTYEYTELIAIQYQPENGQEEIDEVYEKLQDCLEIIEVAVGEDQKKKTRTQQADYAVVDGILTYTLRAADIYFRRPIGDAMEVENVEIGVSHGRES